MTIAPQSRYNNLTVQVETPEGKMFVAIMEDNSEKPVAIDIYIGKAGTLVRAWAHATARLMTLALENGITIEQIIEEFSSQHSSHSRRSMNRATEVWSGPEGICIALMRYKKSRFLRDSLRMGIKDDDDANERGRGPRLAG